MNTDALYILLIFISIIFIGGALEMAYFRHKLKKHKFSFIRYFLFLFFPVLATLFAYMQIGMMIVYVFVVAMVAGLFFEYYVDKAYKIIVGHRLWRYYKYNIGGNTSWLALPIWGFGGVFFFLVGLIFI